jgi:hypothetical protein
MEVAASIATIVVCVIGAVLALVLHRRYLKGEALRIARQAPGEPFAWPKGRWLESLDDATIRLPGAIVQSRETSGEIIELSDENCPVKFTYAEDGTTIEAITVKLRAGTSMKVNTSCDATVLADDGQPRRFRLIAEPA